eukprot:m.334168 g.334168  ORF g.334168 m.334168 type:complete len:134 (+) comp20505_c0_seq36:78-479(+)
MIEWGNLPVELVRVVQQPTPGTLVVDRTDGVETETLTLVYDLVVSMARKMYVLKAEPNRVFLYVAITDTELNDGEAFFVFYDDTNKQEERLYLPLFHVPPVVNYMVQDCGDHVVVWTQSRYDRGMHKLVSSLL